REDDCFSSLALELFALQFKYNAPYRRFCEARGIMPDAVSDWWEIPAVPTAGFKESELTCLPPSGRTAVFHSSGTTERQPSRHIHSEESLAIYEASVLPWFRAHVLTRTANGERRSRNGEHNLPAATPAWRLISLTPPPDLAPHSSLV